MAASNRARRGCLAIAGRVIFSLVLILSALWGGLALAYRLPGGAVVQGAAALAWAGLCLYAAIALWRGRARRAAWTWLVGMAALCVWWQTLAPSNDRIWADDVARTLRGSVSGSIVTLDSVRNFDWQADTDTRYTARWESQQYNLNELVSVDMVLSYWGSPAIAHTLVSFGFTDGRHVVFSVEIRKERGEQFSEVGGFFKQFELSVIAAQERDILYVRAGPRAERVYLYPVDMPVAAMRELFLSYVRTANELADEPRFYHTVTANCTTLVYSMVRAIVPGLPMDYRILLSGYLPEYLYEQGGLDTSKPLAQLREQAYLGKPALPGPDPVAFSRAIRQPPAAGAAQ
ncbi:DUF4105 domain-containing protein [Achromobacter xylosoxidans]|uniref:DUF4105 domain-containing protein n=1 Tax=Alcaligenes xylosoxydans xylosoxydans TaxID=85698 RepID=A0A424WC09_ALCXX|nr:DUF4105 domain-containing protein [Achromobacter xylosoxidans]MBC9906719.1 DUF4105 domain-containing protein [Achromobacter xylosoxidans]MBD0870273.1 DUF4105 domain-containing protein [Achromobacter xylosoxidans]QNP83661.1 DUF4105 domain-containing protein [Achromobacter xylosoxidans]RPJ90710.1 DUF4105 domain-containing protein [Achromobacter xylosoxidans]